MNEVRPFQKLKECDFYFGCVYCGGMVLFPVSTMGLFFRLENHIRRS